MAHLARQVSDGPLGLCAGDVPLAVETEVVRRHC